MSQEEELTTRQAEHMKRFWDEVKKLREYLRLSHRQLKQQALKAAKELDQAGIVDKEDICLEIIKQLREEINNGLVSTDTIRAWLPEQYKHNTGPKGPRIGNNQLKDLPTQEIELIERIAALDFQHIRQMHIRTFIAKYRENYLHTLQTMPDDEVHYQALILGYLHPMARDMLEATETRRAEMKKKDEMSSV